MNFILAIINISSTAFAVCPAPPQSVQTEQARKIEGDVQATLLNVGIGAGGADTVVNTWQTSLPSQESIDNQWYLYHLCREYEAGHLTYSQYCTISAGLWQRITGVPMSTEACVSQPASSPPSGTPAPAAPVAPSTPSPATINGLKPGRWSVLTGNGSVLEAFGPLEIDGKQIVYLENLGGCLSMLTWNGSSWREEIIAGQCSAWAMAVLSQENGKLIIDAPEGKIVMSPVYGAEDVIENGVWAGDLYSTRDSVGLRLTTSGKTGSIDWYGSCTSQLSLLTGAESWRVYKETVDDDDCISGATITIRSIAPGAVYMEWVGPTGKLQALGVLRAN